MNLVEDIRTALAAASSSEGDVHAIYVAVARSRLSAAQRELVSLEAIVAAKERELVRVTHGDARQLDLGGPKP